KKSLRSALRSSYHELLISGRPVPWRSSAAMPLAIVCPACNAGYTLADNVRGKNVRCSRCQRIFVAGTPLRGVPAALPQRPRRSPVGTPPPGYLPAQIQPQSSGIPVALIAGTAVAAVFALILVGGIAIILWQKPHPVQAPLPRPGAVAEVKQPTGNEPSATQLVKDPAPREQPVKEPIVLDPPKDPPPGTVNSDGSLAPAVLQRVKRATVYLRVAVADGSVNQG